LTRLLFEHYSKLRSWNGQLVIYRYYKISLLSCYHHCLTCTQAKLISLTKPQCCFLEVKMMILFLSRLWELSLSTHCQICIQTPEIKVILFTCLNKHLLQRKLGFHPCSTSQSFSFTSKKQNFSIIKVVYAMQSCVWKPTAGHGCLSTSIN